MTFDGNSLEGGVTTNDASRAIERCKELLANIPALRQDAAEGQTIPFKNWKPEVFAQLESLYDKGAVREKEFANIRWPSNLGVGQTREANAIGMNAGFDEATRVLEAVIKDTTPASMSAVERVKDFAGKVPKRAV